ncbi:ATP-binding protein [Enterococcus pallens]|uniref:AAA+ ATPase domain-containing protein n=1 Tax=Enterococcus pallens ATCC BAA-351 TaxID=1158607 RepID=R2T3H5_9ENTE|nr:ATP-binding protein [Enterococcus pallens]EOH94799.1 hypothetical protein UAU_01721 [Enterococcus pallens ATCC BAA-351]EOU14882.1 hypothetical protein I588_04532 [Enterococcus pallens ATCC BAA-351]OJG78144.1 hypothetical protein RV10_GL001632 [Enterococcus pallens]
MLKWANKKQDGSERCGPVCTAPGCGHREMLQRNSEKAQVIVDKAVRDAAYLKMVNNSIVTDQSVWTCNFDNYKIVDHETKDAKFKAQNWANKILNKENVHAIFTGTPGAGKTHLAVAIMLEVLEKSGYQRTCGIVNFRELLEQLRNAIDDAEIRREIRRTLVSELKKMDLVVIDDLGAELGRMEKPSEPTTFVLETLQSLAESRQEKSTIFTSNLNSSQIYTLYGERIYSRMLNGATVDDRLNAFRFKETTDKRRSPI